MIIIIGVKSAACDPVLWLILIVEPCIRSGLDPVEFLLSPVMGTGSLGQGEDQDTITINYY